MFVGTYERTLDDKGRVVLPARLRAQLGGEGFIGRLPEGGLAIWSRQDFEDMAERIDAQVRARQFSGRVFRQFMADSQDFEPDGQGRVSIPERLRPHLDLGSDVVMTGAYDRILVLTPEEFERLGDEEDPDIATDFIAAGI